MQLDKEVILMGDFNINWELKNGRRALKHVITKYDLVQLIKGPTRITSSSSTQTDLVFSNNPERVTKSFNMVTGLSDHNLTLISRKLTKKRFNLTTTPKSSYFRIPKCDQDDFGAAINGINWCDLMSGTNVETGSHLFLSTIQSTLKRFLKEVKPKHCQKSTLPWLNGDIWKLMSE